MRQIFVGLCLSVLLVASAFAADPREVAVSLEVGVSTTFAELPAGVENDFEQDPDHPDPVDVTDKTVKALVPGGPVRITFKNGTSPVLIATVTVTPIDPVITLTLGDESTVIGDSASAIIAVFGDEYRLTVQGHNEDGTLRSITPTKVDSSLRAVVKPTADFKTIDIDIPNTERIDPPISEASVTITLPDGRDHVIRFRIVELPASIAVDLPANVKERDEVAIPVTVTGNAGGVYHSSSTAFGEAYRYSCAYKENDKNKANGFVKVSVIDNVKLRTSRIDTESAGKANVDVRAPGGGVRCEVFIIGRKESLMSKEEIITISQRGGTIRLAPSTLILSRGAQGTVHAEAFDRGNSQIFGSVISWQLLKGADAAVLTPQGDDAVMVTISSDSDKIPKNGLVTLAASTTAQDGSVITTEMPIKIPTVTGFTRVRGGLEMLDYRTAKDLYGSQTAEDFYVAKITLLNDLGADLAGSSILVFSSSLEVGVNMQKTPCRGTRPPRSICKEGDQRTPVVWTPVKYADLRKLGLPVDYPLTSDALPRRYAPGSPKTEFDESIVFTCDDIWYEEQRVQLTADEEKNDEMRSKKQRDHDDRVAASRLRQLHYRPYPYDMVVKSYDPRDQRTTRSQTFRALTFAGSLASFITGVPNFGASKQFIAVNEKFANVLVPALAAAWPSMRETQRQNLVSDTMHPIEEIPYGSSLTKMIFLPKYPFQGFAADTWFRISEICPFDFKVQVALSSKMNEVQVDTRPKTTP